MKVLLYLLTLLAGLTSLHSQPFSWQKVSAFDSLWCITSNGSTMYAGKDNELYSSTDDGFSWKKFFVWPMHADTQGTKLFPYSEMAVCMKATGDLLYVGSACYDTGGLIGGVHLFGPGIVDSIIGQAGWTVICVDELNLQIVASLHREMESAIVYSSNTGIDWQRLNDSDVTSLHFFAGGILGGAPYVDRLDFSTDRGLFWTTLSEGIKTHSLCSRKNILFASIRSDSLNLGFSGAAYSQDTGRTWRSMNFDSTTDMGLNLCVHNDYLYAIANDGIYRTKISQIVAVPDEASPNMRVYPNPTTSTTRLSLPPDAMARSIRICSSEGLMLYESSIDGNFTNTLDVDLGSFASGVYVIQVVTTNAAAVRWVVEKE